MRNHALSLMSFVIISHFIFTKQASFYTSFKHQQGLTSCRGLRRPCTPLLWGLASPPHPHESAGRFTPHKKMLKGRLRRRTASVFLPQRREGRRGSLRPRQIDRASCVGARIAPTPPWKRGTLHPNCFKRGGFAVGAIGIGNIFTFPHFTLAVFSPKATLGATLIFCERGRIWSLPSLVPCALRARAHLVPPRASKP